MQLLKQWQIKDGDPGVDTAATRNGEGWIEATAPGDTYAALIAAGKLAHPFKGRNETAAAAIATREWHWRTQFETVGATIGERVELVFDGLDTFADIYLNGDFLGRADNMFRAWRFEVGSLLRHERANEVLVVFHPTDRSVPARELPNWGAMTEKLNASKRSLMRKAQFGWGWDWGPYLPTVGIWREVRLERWSGARLDDVRATVSRLSTEQCELRIDVAVETLASLADLSANIILRNPQGEIAAQAALALDPAGSVTLTIDKPQLWWTADLGAQPLYTLDVQLLQNTTTLDRQQQRIGLRTISLDQSADDEEAGTTFFRFLLNGVPIFARGACWIPADSFVGIVDRAHYQPLLQQALRANMNMLRVWGGGVYEHDAFYDLCDEMGLLVWQDFMFACAPYPEDDEAFVDNIRNEVQYQIKRLRHHPAMALWCGNNECQVLQEFVNLTLNQATRVQGTLYYDQLIPEAIARLDLAVPYWPGSPWGGGVANSMRAGDVHDWTVWHGVPLAPDDAYIGVRDLSPAGVHYQRYAEDMARFVSEFGIHSSPSLSFMKRWMDADDLRIDAPGFLERIKDEPKNKVYAMLEPVTGLPTTLAEYIDFTMLLQAEGLKFGIEHFRRRKPHCSGTLIWQLNDCWPCVSWSLLDYEGGGKASLYAVARAYAPVLASFKQTDGGSLELWITNDRLAPVQGQALIERQSLVDGLEWSQRFEYSVAANASECIWRGAMPGDRADVVIRASSMDNVFAPNRHLPVPIKDLQLVRDAQPAYTVIQVSPHELDVTLSAEAYLLMVSIEDPFAGTLYSDNYFDLCCAEQRTVRISNCVHALSAQDLVLRCWNARRP